MAEPKVVKLPSGATLTITPAPFAMAKTLYQAVFREGKGVELHSNMQVMSFWKQIFCTSFASLEIEAALLPCMSFATYGRHPTGANPKINIAETFEDVEAREDYLTVCMEVGKENIFPFVKSLYAEYRPMFDAILKPQA